MTSYVLPPPAVVSVPVVGSTERFPVARILCVGRNYEAHAREMGKDPTRDKPFFFMKPADAIVPDGASVPYPPLTSNFHYEIELVLAIGKGGRNIAEENALDHIWGYAVGIDLTRRDLQQVAKDNGHPWEWGKAFDQSAPMAAIHPASKVGHISKGRIWLSVNGTVKQDQDIADLIWSIPEIVSICSKSMELKPGDLIMTGTPSGVGSIKPGDKVVGGIDGLGEIAITIAPALT